MIWTSRSFFSGRFLGVGGRAGDEKIEETGNFGIRESWTSRWLMPSKFIGSTAL